MLAKEHDSQVLPIGGATPAGERQTDPHFDLKAKEARTGSVLPASVISHLW